MESMQLNSEQARHLVRGEPVPIVIGGEPCVILTRQSFEELSRLGYDDSPWTVEEMDLLAGEAADLISGDGFDEEDDE